MITHDELKRLFRYDSGHLIRLVSRGNSKGGGVAGTKDSHGHLQVYVNGGTYLVHRLIRFLLKGNWPKELDHINGIRDDNRIENLREVTRQQNLFNRKATTGSTSKYKGVSWKSKNNKWVAQCCVSGKVKHLGLYNTEEKAHEVYENYTEEIHGQYRYKN